MRLERFFAWATKPATDSAPEPAAPRFDASYALIAGDDDGYTLCPSGKNQRLSLSADMLRTLPAYIRHKLATRYALAQQVHVCGSYDPTTGQVTKIDRAAGIPNDGRLSTKGSFDRSFPVPGGNSTTRSFEHAYFLWHPDDLRPMPRHPEVSVVCNDGQARLQRPLGHTTMAFGYEYQFYQRTMGNEARKLRGERELARPADWAPWSETCPAPARDAEARTLMQAIRPLLPEIGWFAIADFDALLAQEPLDRDAMRALMRDAVAYLGDIRAEGQTPAANNPIGTFGIDPRTLLTWAQGLTAEDISPQDQMRRLGAILKSTWQDPHRLIQDMQARLRSSSRPYTYFDRDFMTAVIGIFEALKARSEGQALPRDIDDEAREAHGAHVPEWRLWSTPEASWGFPLVCPEHMRLSEAEKVTEVASRLLGSEPKTLDQARAQAWAQSVVDNPHDSESAFAGLRALLQRPEATSTVWFNSEIGERWLAATGDEASVPMWQGPRELDRDLRQRVEKEYIDGPLLSAWGQFLSRIATDLFRVWDRRRAPQDVS